MSLSQARRVLSLVFVVQADQRHGFVAREFVQQWMFHAAGYAPRRPDVEQVYAPAQLRRADFALWVGDRRQRKCWQRLADERRGMVRGGIVAALHFVDGVAEQQPEDGEQRNRDDKPLHGRLFWPGTNVPPCIALAASGGM